MYVHCQRMRSAKDITHQNRMDSSKNGGGVWCNPPYGREITDWVRKACEEIEKPYCNCIVMLLPARTDTFWFQNYVLAKAFLYFIDGRLAFNGQEHNAPFPSVLAIYLGKQLKARK